VSSESTFERRCVVSEIRASVFVGVSVDGFMARRDGGLEWLPSDCEPHGYSEFMETVDALLIGRNTFDVVLAFDAWPYGDKPVYVLSSRPLAPAPPGAVVERLSGDAGAVAAELAGRGHEHVYVDGGITIQQFLRAGRIQRLVVTRVPVLIGEGTPLFGAVPSDIRLRHVATRSFPSGLVQTEYHIGDDPDTPGLWA